MCDFEKSGQVIGNAMDRNNLDADNVFERQNRISPACNAAPGRDFQTGEVLSPGEIDVPGACTRHFLKNHNYLRIITRPNQHECGHCGDPLPADKIEAIRHNPRELSKHLCDECRDYFALMAAVTLGDPVAYQVVHGAAHQPAPHMAVSEQRMIPQQTGSGVSAKDVIDMINLSRARREPVYAALPPRR